MRTPDRLNGRPRWNLSFAAASGSDIEAALALFAPTVVFDDPSTRHRQQRPLDMTVDRQGRIAHIDAELE